ncbi:hypothetical protein [Antrihabitans spumae]|uniref:Uncharacterized protein n=1 Tax=Antrihabitans spumae TaxID=3373370 RepID=A0ABW7KRI8_9NOCA
MNLRGTVGHALLAHRPLQFAAFGSLAIAGIALIGVFLDPRELVNAPIWLKSFKFGISIAIYTTTLAVLLPHVTRARRTARGLCTIIAAGIFLELALITFQIVRGTLSHFNFQTVFDTAVTASMGIIIVIVWLSNIVLAVFVLASRGGDQALRIAVGWGLVIGLVGMGLAFTMTAEEAGLIENPTETIMGAHSVGIADGGPGLPITGWSTVAGDLRVPHFVGLHAMQVVPLIAFAIAWLSRRSPAIVSEGARVPLSHIAGVAYSGLVVLSFWQAARGQSIVQPDAMTLSAAGALVAGTTIAAIVTLVLGARRRPPPTSDRSLAASPAPAHSQAEARHPRRTDTARGPEKE